MTRARDLKASRKPPLCCLSVVACLTVCGALVFVLLAKKSFLTGVHVRGEWKKKTLETLQGIVEAFQIDASIQDEDIKRCLYFDSVEAQRSLEGMEALKATLYVLF